MFIQNSKSKNYHLPSGTITFLFTDIEGSTKLAQQYPERWESLRARHHTILRSAIEFQNGYVFQIIGDAFCAAFHTAGEALQAALKSQVSLRTEDWGDAPVKVRMGIHTGKAEIQEGGDYSGYVTLCHVQRLMSAGHGGQTLLSQTTQDLVRDELPEGISLRDLGEHRLKDLTRPDRIFQLLSPDFPADFPPLKTLDKLANNLPVQLTSFIGREKEITEVKELLNVNRLVTITGPGGTGKTRLSLQTAAELLDVFANGVWQVELASLADSALVPQAIASALDVREQQGRPLQDTLIDYLREKKLLLVLDNCEHLVEACATLADSLLHTCPGLKILASSREALGISGEVPFRLPSLSTPDPRHLPDTQRLLQYEAVRLFSERATTTMPAFSITDANALALAQVCCRLDGIPLAIELAAARIRMLSVEQIAARLDDCFRLLTGGSRTALPRLQTLQAMIDWSYDLLSDSESTMFCRLSVFAGGWTLEAAEAVCAYDCTGTDALELLTHLADKSLVVVDYELGQAVRYRLLETIRQYARQKLAETGQVAQVRSRHLAYFLQFAEEAELHLLHAEQLYWLAILEREHDNLRTALEWALAEAGADPSAPPEAGLRISAALYRFWHMRGYQQEARYWFERALESPDQPKRTLARAKALGHAQPFVVGQKQVIKLVDECLAICRELGDKSALAYALQYKANHTEGLYLAQPLFEESLGLFRELGDHWGIAYTLFLLGAKYQYEVYAIPAARKLYEESLVLFREAGDRRGIQYILDHLGFMAMDQGDLSSARSFFMECLSLTRELGDKGTMAAMLRHLGLVALGQGDYLQALELHDEGLAIVREFGEKDRINYILSDQGRVARFQGDYQRAADLLKEPLLFARQAGDKPQTVRLLICLGELARLQGEFATACTFYKEALAIARGSGEFKKSMAYLFEESAALSETQGKMKPAAILFAAAQALRKTIHTVPLPVENIEIDRHISVVKSKLDESTFKTAWARGRKMTYDQAVAYLAKQLKSSKSEISSSD